MAMVPSFKLPSHWLLIPAACVSLSSLSAASDCDLFAISQLCISQQLALQTTSRGRGGLPRTLSKQHKMQSLHLYGGRFSTQHRGTGSPVLPLEEVYLKGCFHSKYNAMTQTCPLDSLLLDGLRFLSSWPCATQPLNCLLFPVPARSLWFPRNPVLAPHGWGWVPEEVPSRGGMHLLLLLTQRLPSPLLLFFWEKALPRVQVRTKEARGLYSSLYQEKPPYRKLQFLADFIENCIYFKP